MYRPAWRTFRELHRLNPRIPVAACLPFKASPLALFQPNLFSPPWILLESARTHPVTGRFSLLVGEPSSLLVAQEGQVQWITNGTTRVLGGNPLDCLKQILNEKLVARIPGFPPFVGGAVGFLGFNAYRYIEELPCRALDDLHLPDLFFLFCDQTILVDHLQEKLWVIALADPALPPHQAYAQAIDRIERLAKRLFHEVSFPPSVEAEGKLQREPDPHFREDDISLEFTPAKAVREIPQIVSATHTQSTFEAMVREAKRFIADGEIYQVNLSQRFAFPLLDEPWTSYQRLKAINPSPFAAFADLGFSQVICGSPERLLRVEGPRAQTRPIAGTRPRGATPFETAQMRKELILNEKERAEHLMLVDLERNDLGRVCRYGSVKVNDFMVLEEYSHVIHIVSNVQGTLKPKVHPMDLVLAAFPGGTITGCPKIRSIEIIDCLEPVRRQWYTGSLGYISYTGEMDLNLLIRTAFVVNGTVYVQAGAGIVADSDPTREFEETLHKAQALVEALGVEEGSTTESVVSAQENCVAVPGQPSSPF